MMTIREIERFAVEQMLENMPFEVISSACSEFTPSQIRRHSIADLICNEMIGKSFIPSHDYTVRMNQYKIRARVAYILMELEGDID